jgi:hypothetical protein
MERLVCSRLAIRSAGTFTGIGEGALISGSGLLTRGLPFLRDWRPQPCRCPVGDPLTDHLAQRTLIGMSARTRHDAPSSIAGRERGPRDVSAC